MPRGTRYALAGTLRWTRFGYALEMDDGGVWRLDVGSGVKRLIDRAVRIEGIRSGFDLLDVQRIWAEGDLRPASLRERLAAWFSRWRKR